MNDNLRLDLTEQHSGETNQSNSLPAILYRTAVVGH